jgi:hypothetical protein
MISKHYCPKCHSFDLFKLHRSFVEKRILGSENKFQCRSCEQVFKPSVFESNLPKEVPVFLDQIQQRPMANTASQASISPKPKVAPQAAVKDPQVEKVVEASPVNEVAVEDTPVITSSNVSTKSSQMMLNGDFMSEDNFKVTETVRNKADEQKAIKKTKVRKAPPAHKSDEQFVDEPIITTEKKSVWPYALGSAMVLLGASYAFIWMPLTSNASTSDLTQMDMSIGSPGQVWSDAKVNTASVLPEVVDVDNNDSVEKTVLSSSVQHRPGTPQIKSDIQVKLEEIALGKESKVETGNDSEALESLAAAKMPTKALFMEKTSAASETIDVKLKQEIPDVSMVVETAPSVISSEQPLTEVASLKVKDYSLKHNTGTKADNALGGLSSANSPKKVLTVNSSVPTVATVKQSNSVIEANKKVKVPLPETSVRQYAVKPVSTTPPVLQVENKPAEIKAVLAKPVRQTVKKKQVISTDNTKLLERAAVKLMQQDLDKLF